MPTDADSQLLRHELVFLAGALGVARPKQTYGDNAPLRIRRRTFVNGHAADVLPGACASSAPLVSGQAGSAASSAHGMGLGRTS
jgi:hypothetical protein